MSIIIFQNCLLKDPFPSRCEGVFGFSTSLCALRASSASPRSVFPWGKGVSNFPLPSARSATSLRPRDRSFHGGKEFQIFHFPLRAPRLLRALRDSSASPRERERGCKGQFEEEENWLSIHFPLKILESNSKSSADLIFTLEKSLCAGLNKKLKSAGTIAEGTFNTKDFPSAIK
jgi:hypothetical protein